MRETLGEGDALVDQALPLHLVRSANGLDFGTETHHLVPQRSELVELLPGGGEMRRCVTVRPKLLDLLAEQPQLGRRLRDDRAQDELVRRRLGVGGEPFADRLRDLGHLDLGLADIEPLSQPVRDHISGLLEEILERRACEEAQVRVVEQAPLAVAELAAEEREPDARMGDVRDRRDDDAVLGDERPHPAEHVVRLLQVLEHVGEQDDVELLTGQLGGVVDRLRVADDHALRVLLGERCCVTVDLDADDRAAEPVLEHLGHVAGGAAELEHARGGRDERDDLAVRRSRVVLELCVLEGVLRRGVCLVERAAEFVFHGGEVNP